MIIDDKLLQCPPPPYALPSLPSPQCATPTTTPPNAKPTLPLLPVHILIQIIYATSPGDPSAQPTKVTTVASSSSPILLQSSTSYSSRPASGYTGYDSRIYEDTKAEKQRRVLFWLSTSLRLVCRQLYIACMHVLRSTYLPSYQALIRPPYSTDPFPSGVPVPSSGSSSSSPMELTVPAERGFTSHGSASSLTLSGGVLTTPTRSPSSPSSIITSLQRETVILDQYIALKITQDVYSDDTEFHIERHDAFRDLFEVAQPRARLEDLVRVHGVREGVVSITTPGLRNDRIRTMTLRGHVRSPSLSSSSSLSSQQTTATTTKPPKQSRNFFSFIKKPSSGSTTSSTKAPFPPTPVPAPPIQPLSFSLLTVTFSPRKVGLIYNRTRTIAEVQRGSTVAERKSETLESLAGGLVLGLRDYLEGH